MSLLTTPPRAAADATEPTVLDRPGRWGRLRARVHRFGRAPRLLGLDAARGLAVIGMIGAHVGSVPELAWSRPETWGGVVHGRSSILFALIAGISVALATGGRERPQGEGLRRARLRMAGRALAVLCIGLALEALGTPIIVILAIYGVLFLFLLPVIGWSRRRLLIVAAVATVVGPALSFLVSGMVLYAMPGPAAEMMFWGSYPATVWLPLMLVGMALGRSDLSSRRVAATLVGVGAALSVTGYAGAAALPGAPAPYSESSYESYSSSSSGPLDTTYTPGPETDLTGFTCADDGTEYIVCMPEEDFAAVSRSSSSSSGMPVDTDGYLDSFEDFGGFATVWENVLSSSPHSGGTAEILGAGGLAMAVVGLCLLLGRPLRWLLLPLATVGSMPLTAYSLHVVSMGVLVAPVALFAKTMSGVGANLFWLWCVLALVVLCSLWAFTRGQGPLEQLTGWAARAIDSPGRRPAER